MNPRQGTDKDVKNLRNAFGDLGFTVEVFDDLKYGDVYNVLQKGKYWLFPAKLDLPIFTYTQTKIFLLIQFRKWIIQITLV